MRGVSLNIKKGEFIVILGKSGSGKTSMLNILGTIDQPTRGDLVICGQRISPRSTDEQLANLRLNNLGFVFQSFNLISTMNARENVELPMILAGKLTSSEIKKRAMNLLKRVNMEERHDHKPSQLSGGEQQRVTIARAIANNPELLLLDEPTGDLDTVNSRNVIGMLLDLNMNEGITMVMVTHDVSMRNHAHRVVNMIDGKISHIDVISEEQRIDSYQKLMNDKGEIGAKSSSPSAPITEFRNPRAQFHWIRKS